MQQVGRRARNADVREGSLSVVTSRSAKSYLLSSLRISSIAAPVSARLDEDIEDFAFRATDTFASRRYARPSGPIPAAARPWSPPSRPPREEWSTPQHPAPDRFAGQIEPALEGAPRHRGSSGEARIEPDRVLDDGAGSGGRGRKARPGGQCSPAWDQLGATVTMPYDPNQPK